MAVTTSMVTPRLRAAIVRRVASGVPIALLCGCATATSGREPLVSDRPDFTEATYTIPRGQVQVEGGHTFSRVDAEKANTTGEVLVRIGLAPSTELRIEPGSYTVVTAPSADSRGREDGALGLKVRLHNAADDRPSIIPEMSLVLLTSVPTGSSVYRQRAWQPEAKFASQWTFTDRVALSTNLNVGRLADDDGRFTELDASASLGVDLSPRFGAYAELFALSPQRRGVSAAKYANTGLTASITPDFQLDVRVGIGLNAAGPDYFLGAGLARRW